MSSFKILSEIKFGGGPDIQMQYTQFSIYTVDWFQKSCEKNKYAYKK